VGGVSPIRPAFDAYLLCREGGADAGVVLKICCARRPIRRSPPDCLTNAFGLHAWARSRLRTAAEVALAASDTILDSHS
jgi:hypothetical protein